MVSAASILAPSEPGPFALEGTGANSPFLIVCEHAGHRIPHGLGTLGLAAEHLQKHFMWDIGALDLARAIAVRLEAPLVHQAYSRMVCDCNRSPEVESFIPLTGEGIEVPGNAGLTGEDRANRQAAIWQPFQDGLAAVLDQRAAQGQPTLFVTIHSFTPVFFGTPRPWHLGVLFDRDDTLSPALFEVLRARHGDKVAENEPYAVSRASDYSIPVHGEDRALPCVEIEVRNDLLGDAASVDAMADDLSDALRVAATAIGAGTVKSKGV